MTDAELITSIRKLLADYDAPPVSGPPSKYPAAFMEAILSMIGPAGHPEKGWEGGYENDPRDPGGETNLGIDKRDHPNEDIKHMTWDRAVEIYYNDYWLPPRYDLLPPVIGKKMLHLGSNMGTHGATVCLQRAVNHMVYQLVVDGRIGPNTLEAVNVLDPVKLHLELRVTAEAYYRSLAGFPTFGKGWLNRNNAT